MLDDEGIQLQLFIITLYLVTSVVRVDTVVVQYLITYFQTAIPYVLVLYILQL